MNRRNIGSVHDNGNKGKVQSAVFRRMPAYAIAHLSIHNCIVFHLYVVVMSTGHVIMYRVACTSKEVAGILSYCSGDNKGYLLICDALKFVRYTNISG